ncbi:hypothetical protein ALC56_15347 [Trachymyrmex septentrionalis]|uniref:Uncharacterized protein n=1 Tax=Trachymyrmex septentrionalis TaxID=34720 RepID=A0A151JT92_9HYME|nr:hypothetical protein ALC56_15347 [Trachymyrmex septentrionalis]
MCLEVPCLEVHGARGAAYRCLLDTGRSPEVIAKLRAITALFEQNIDLNAREWVVLRESESRDAKSAHFADMIDGASLEILKICEF